MLAEEYNIPATDKLKSEVVNMCNLSQGIEDKGIAKGEARKAIEIAKNGFKNNIAIETISIMTKLSVFELQKIQKQLCS